MGYYKGFLSSSNSMTFHDFFHDHLQFSATIALDVTFSQHGMHRPGRKRTANKRVPLGLHALLYQTRLYTNLHAVKNML